MKLYKCICRGVTSYALVLGLLFRFCVASSYADTTDVLAQVETKMAGTKTVAAQFVQKKYLSIFDNVMVIRGHIALEKPGRFAWHVEQPMHFSMVLDGHKMKNWDEDTDKIQTFSMDSNPIFKAAVGQMRQWFEGEYQKLTDEYDISVVSQNPVSLSFNPKADNPAKNYIKNLDVSFREDMRYINKIVINENNGDKTELKFFETKLDEQLPKTAWQLGN